MPSTPSAYPQVFSRCLASFRVVNSAVPQFSTIFAPGSIPGSSTEEKLVKAKSLGQLSFSHQYSARCRDVFDPSRLPAAAHAEA
jgi:hypothetical protein